MEETNNTTPQPTTAYGSNGGAADSYFAVPGDSTGSGSGSLQNDGFLSSGGGGDGSGYDAEFGFQRPEFLTEKLAGTVQVFDRHIFLCYKTPHVWPPQVEAAEFDRLPRLLSAAVKARRGDMKKLTRLTICEGEDGTESSNGDVLFFPDMIRYSRLTHFDVDTFVEETLVKDIEWMPGTPEKLTGSYVFVCAHGSRDRRCGVCGPPLIKKFKEEINIRGLQDKVFVSPCSHIGGHKYAGNVIIFSRMGDDGEVKGNWYGYVSPDDVPALLDQHIAAGEILPHLWRGQMKTWTHTLQHDIGYCQQCPEKVSWPAALGPRPPLYFNAGMFVTEPSIETCRKLLSQLKISSPTSFAEQDFLNAFFNAIYEPIPTTYNLILAMLWRHPGKVDLEKVKVVHYCADGSKPWRYTGKEVNMERDDIKMLVKKWWDIYNGSDEDSTLMMMKNGALSGREVRMIPQEKKRSGRRFFFLAPSAA